MSLSHFKERPLPYYYPILFAAAVFGLAMGYVHYVKA
jgi:hypothetical protein